MGRGQHHGRTAAARSDGMYVLRGAGHFLLYRSSKPGMGPLESTNIALKSTGIDSV